MASIATFPTPPRLNRFGEALNRLSALFLILLLAPVMLLIAWRILREDDAPILFTHYRVGRNGRPFRCFKFRTMVRNSDQVLADLLALDPTLRLEWQNKQKLLRDPRVTRIGHVLRRTSLDELPQLFNVWRGEMNFVGPRPIIAQELERYGPWKRHYLSVRPGITGLWQVSGRNDTSYDQRVELDRHYVEKRSALLDAVILIKTIKVVALREGAR